MHVYHRQTCVVIGVPLAAYAVAGLCYLFFVIHAYIAADGPDAASGVRRFVGSLTYLYAPVLLGVAVLHVGLLLCVKAANNPPRFRMHTRRHLVMASGLSWVLATALFVGFALLPK